MDTLKNWYNWLFFGDSKSAEQVSTGNKAADRKDPESMKSEHHRYRQNIQSSRVPPSNKKGFKVYSAQQPSQISLTATAISAFDDNEMDQANIIIQQLPNNVYDKKILVQHFTKVGQLQQKVSDLQRRLNYSEELLKNKPSMKNGLFMEQDETNTACYKVLVDIQGKQFHRAYATAQNFKHGQRLMQKVVEDAYCLAKIKQIIKPSMRGMASSELDNTLLGKQANEVLSKIYGYTQQPVFKGMIRALKLIHFNKTEPGFREEVKKITNGQAQRVVQQVNVQLDIVRKDFNDLENGIQKIVFSDIPLREIPLKQAQQKTINLLQDVQMRVKAIKKGQLCFVSNKLPNQSCQQCRKSHEMNTNILGKLISANIIPSQYLYKAPPSESVNLAIDELLQLYDESVIELDKLLFDNFGQINYDKFPSPSQNFGDNIPRKHFQKWVIGQLKEKISKPSQQQHNEQLQVLKQFKTKCEEQKKEIENLNQFKVKYNNSWAIFQPLIYSDLERFNNNLIPPYRKCNQQFIGVFDRIESMEIGYREKDYGKICNYFLRTIEVFKKVCDSRQALLKDYQNNLKAKNQLHQENISLRSQLEQLKAKTGNLTEKAGQDSTMIEPSFRVDDRKDSSNHRTENKDQITLLSVKDAKIKELENLLKKLEEFTTSKVINFRLDSQLEKNFGSLFKAIKDSKLLKFDMAQLQSCRKNALIELNQVKANLDRQKLQNQKQAQLTNKRLNQTRDANELLQKEREKDILERQKLREQLETKKVQLCQSQGRLSQQLKKYSQLQKVTKALNNDKQTEKQIRALKQKREKEQAVAKQIRKLQNQKQSLETLLNQYQENAKLTIQQSDTIKNELQSKLQQIKQAETKTRILQNKIKQEEKKTRILQDKIKQEETKTRSLQNKIKQEEMKTRSLSGKIKQEERKTRSLQNKIKQEETKTRSLQDKIKQLEHTMKQNSSPKFGKLFVGDILDFEADHKKWLIDCLETRMKREIIRTKQIYRYDPLNKTNFHEYIDRHPNLLVLIRTEGGKLLGSFSQGACVPNQVSTQYGFLFSMTNRIVFEPKQDCKSYKTISYDKQYYIFGNSELGLRTSENKVFSNFDTLNSYFESQGKNVDILLGEGEKVRNAQISTYEFYKIQFQT